MKKRFVEPEVKVVRLDDVGTDWENSAWCVTHNCWFNAGDSNTVHKSCDISYFETSRPSEWTTPSTADTPVGESINEGF